MYANPDGIDTYDIDANDIAKGINNNMANLDLSKIKFTNINFRCK